MRKLRKSRDEYLPPVKLFVDDVESVIEVMSKASSEPTFNIRTEEYELDHARELSELNREYISELHVKLLEPSICLDIQSDEVRLHATEDTVTTRGVLEELNDFLRSRKVWLSVHDPITLFAIQALVITAAVLALIGSFMKTYDILYGGFGLLAVTLLCLAQSSRRGSVIVLKRHTEQESFWRRNRDQITVGIISAIVGGMITLFITWAAGFFR